MLWKKLKKGLYVNLETGEYVEKKLSDISFFKAKNSNMKSIYQAIKRVRQTINCNFFGELDERFITLTYKENMQDVKRLSDDFNKFIKRLKYYLKDDDLLYINIIEPQERGAWHCHILVKTSKANLLNRLVIDNLWGFGFVYCSMLTNISNVGAYLSAYLTNTKDKKGARLYLYPQNCKIMRCSRNVKRPIKKVMYFSDFKKEFKHYRLKYIKSYDLVKDNLELINSVVYRSYERV